MEDFKEAVHFTNSGVGFQNIRISFREKHLRLLEKYESKVFWLGTGYILVRLSLFWRLRWKSNKISGVRGGKNTSYHLEPCQG